MDLPEFTATGNSQDLTSAAAASTESQKLESVEKSLESTQTETDNSPVSLAEEVSESTEISAKDDASVFEDSSTISPIGEPEFAQRSIPLADDDDEPTLEQVLEAAIVEEPEVLITHEEQAAPDSRADENSSESDSEAAFKQASSIELRDQEIGPAEVAVETDEKAEESADELEEASDAESDSGSDPEAGSDDKEPTPISRMKARRAQRGQKEAAEQLTLDDITADAFDLYIDTSTQAKEESEIEEGAQTAASESTVATVKILAPTAPPTPEPEELLQTPDGENVTPSDGIEILVRMAKLKEIDPKAVDIIEVTDKFLKLIAAAPKENLRQSGKILFHACVLLRMKAEALLVFSVEEEPPADDFLDFEDDDGIMDSDNPGPRQITFADLERAIVRKSQRRKPRRRQVTLEELIQALKDAEELEKTRADRKPKARIELAGQHDVEGVDDLLDLAHDEDIETTIQRVELLLAQILKFGENIELFTLVAKLDDHNDWVDAFLASLFLSNAGKIDLTQHEFYGPLFLSLGGDPSVANTVTP